MHSMLEKLLQVSPMNLATTISLVDAVGASESATPDCLTLYIPSHNRHEQRIDQKKWLEEALDLLGFLGGEFSYNP